MSFIFFSYCLFDIKVEVIIKNKTIKTVAGEKRGHGQ